MAENEQYIINKKSQKPDCLNYDKLRQVGMEYIQKLSSSIWTDYNLHDPGVTTFELLCYALTDLGYRSSFDIKDIIAVKDVDGSQNGERPDLKDAFITAENILPSNPTTIEDYRKLILENVPGVKNVHLNVIKQPLLVPKALTGKEEVVNLNGFYDVTVELEEYNVISEYAEIIAKNVDDKMFEKDYKDYYRRYILNLLLRNRNICEDFDIDNIHILEPVPIGICLNVEVKSDIKYDTILLEIYRSIYNYISPSISLYTLNQLLGKGKAVEEIYQGAIPSLGFVDYEELVNFEQRKQLYVSDIINLIMSVEGVISIRHLHFMLSKENSVKIKIGENNQMVSTNDDYTYFVFYIDDLINKEVENHLNKVVITLGNLSFTPEKLNISGQNAKSLVKSITQSGKGVIKNLDVKLPLPSPGQNRELDEYISIQDDFPKTYKVGKEGIAGSESDLRKAQRLQFKSYLLFFDQLLADFLSQLNSVKEILSWRERDNNTTYFFKSLTDDEITDFSKVFEGYDNYQTVLESNEVKQDRRNRFLNHLLARFNEQFTDYSIIKYLEGNSFEIGLQEQIKDKAAYLKKYQTISCLRSRSIDYTSLEQPNLNVAEFRICKKLGIDDYSTDKRLSPTLISDKDGKYAFVDNSNDSCNVAFGIHIYEHILFRPFSDNPVLDDFIKLATDIDSVKLEADPYSMRLTIVVPGWLTISKNTEFRKFIEEKIRLELPAHIAAKICWLNPLQMYLLEQKYDEYMKVFRNRFSEKDTQSWKNNAHQIALREFVSILSSLKNMYPTTILFDNVNAQDATVLDFSAIGEANNEPEWSLNPVTISKQTSTETTINNKKS